MISKAKDIFQPFKVAMSGLVYTFRTQRHMRFHMTVVLIVLLLGIFLNFGLREVMVLLFTVSLVMVAEMFNSAIEATVDLASPNYHPLARFAKDIAAGAVLISTMIALIIGALLIVGENRWEGIKLNLTADSPALPFTVRLIIGVFLVFLVVVIGKGLGQRGQVLKGGLVSGHAAYGFFFATSIVFISQNAVVSGLALLLASIVAQSRYEAKIHSLFELCLGGTVGVVLGVLVFSILPK